MIGIKRGSEENETWVIVIIMIVIVFMSNNRNK